MVVFFLGTNTYIPKIISVARDILKKIGTTRTCVVNQKLIVHASSNLLTFVGRNKIRQ